VVVIRGPLRVVVNLAAIAQALPLDGEVLGVLLSSSPGVAIGTPAALELPAESVAVVRMAGS
jgi:hypothetical protein